MIAAALVVGWRVEGWRGALTQAMARWLAVLIVFGLVSRQTGGNIDNAAHLGGALAGAVIVAMWRKGHRYSERVSTAVLAACGGVLAVCVGIVAVRDRTDRFATMTLSERSEFASVALADGRCRDAYDGLLAVERLRAGAPAVLSLRAEVEATCGANGEHS
jgi:hypothetical protein